ncbi:hypothetical protein L1987_33732 [Smallanthus sonchifolius]|uniref:Uncharacterized protein n=1 Tax=Smallanthus sonchifolius TaxID=185202 RepID=A0ACB9HTJ5_9ASTR|nr:hypothetical protein L1987_33732 [Smallanthus sonchifolius]
MRIWETMSVDLGRTPFLFSKLHNKFVYEGCGSASIRHNTSRISGCSASCGNDALSDGNSCFGFHCCQTAVPYHLKSYNINFFRYDRQREAGREAGREDGWEDRGCGSAFLVDRTSFDQRKFSVGNTSLIPTSLLWTLADSDQVTCCYNRTRFRRKVDMFNSTPVDTWQCDGWSTKGTPYLIDGCDNQGNNILVLLVCLFCDMELQFILQKCLRKSVEGAKIMEVSVIRKPRITLMVQFLLRTLLANIIITVLEKENQGKHPWE